jgi:hypothetical protein
MLSLVTCILQVSYDRSILTCSMQVTAPRAVYECQTDEYRKAFHALRLCGR